MRELNVELEQLTRTTVDYSEHIRPDFSSKEFSGVTNKLLEIGNEIQLAVDPAPQQSDSLTKLNIRFNEIVPFDVFEGQIKNNFVSIQNHTAHKVLKRFYKKLHPVDAEMQTEVEPVNRVVFRLQEEINELTKRLRRAEEDMIYNKLKAQTVEVVAKDTKEELKHVQVTLVQTNEQLKTTVQEAVKLKAVVEEQKIIVKETKAELREVKQEKQQIEVEKRTIERKISQISRVQEEEMKAKINSLAQEKLDL